MDGDGESWLTGWEQQCADVVEGQPDYEQSLTIEADNSLRKIWTVFQDSATAIAQLYRGKSLISDGLRVLRRCILCWNTCHICTDILLLSAVFSFV